MTDFIIHFLICNLFIGVIIILLFGLKRLFRNTLTGRTQYNLWFLLLALLAVPFLPVSSGQPAGILYWFNPLVWTAFAAIRGDREIACDASVLRMLDKEDYRDYGFTLINFAEKLSHTVFPFSAGLGGSMKQIRRRILNIAAYRKPSALKMMKNIAVYSLTAALLAGLSPALFSHASEDEHYQWSASGQNISSIDMAEYFDGYDGSFVLYDLNNDRWSIYNEEQASVRVSPDSTYKIYDALFALEEGIISPDASGLAWDGTLYPFESWNQDQTLASALSVSANWYFQELDRQMGTDVIRSRIREIGYGNENISGSPDSYWMESGLKISPIEQVKLLTDLYRNTFDFAPENIRAVKDSLRLSASPAGTLYGKTGTGQVDGQNVNGWFVGFTETADNTYFFAVNIHAESNASGSSAAEIALDVLDEMDIWKQPDGNKED